jgi:2'-5' RNA ligase
MLEQQEPRTGDAPPASELTEHWSWRPEWTSERRSWWWYVTFEHDAAVHWSAERARAVLQPRGPVHVVPPRWLHLSLAEVGYVAEVPRRAAYDAARTAQACLADIAPLCLDVGPISTMPGAVVLRVRGQGLDELQERLVSALADDLPHRPVQRPFDPHVSVAYISKDCRSLDVLAEVRGGLPTVTTGLNHVSLVEVVRDERHYRWTPRCRVSLSGHRPARHLQVVG